MEKRGAAIRSARDVSRAWRRKDSHDRTSTKAVLGLEPSYVWAGYFGGGDGGP